MFNRLPDSFYHQSQLTHILLNSLINMHFALIHLALSFLALTTSVVTAPVAVETDDASALCMFDSYAHQDSYHHLTFSQLLLKFQINGLIIIILVPNSLQRKTSGHITIIRALSSLRTLRNAHITIMPAPRSPQRSDGTNAMCQ